MAKQYNIIRTSKELDVYTKYELLESPSIVSLKTIGNRDLVCVGDWAEYTTKDNSGNDITCISIQDANTGEVFSGQSQTFRDTFSDIIDRISDMEEKPDMFFIEVLHRKSKAGRDYLICALVSPDRALSRMGISYEKTPMNKPE